jgi:hypothetical protein
MFHAEARRRVDQGVVRAETRRRREAADASLRRTRHRQRSGRVALGPGSKGSALGVLRASARTDWAAGPGTTVGEGDSYVIVPFCPTF